MRILFIVLACFSFTACGFQPVYGDKTITDTRPANNGAPRLTSVTQALNSISVGNIPDQSGQALRNILLDRLYTKSSYANTRYTLEFSGIGERRKSLGIDKDASITRSQLELSTNMVLRDITDDTVILRRSLRSVSSYNVLGSQYTTLVTRQDARKQGLNELANNAINALELYFLNSDK